MTFILLYVGSSIGKKRKLHGGKKAGLRKKLPTWSHLFVCLAHSNQDTLPDGEERALLQIAALGEKKISFCAFADAQDIYHELLFQFPKLSEAGGFELLRSPEGGGKQLDVIAAPESGYTVAYLRARPMQRELCLDPVKEEVSMFIFTMHATYFCLLQACTDPPKEPCLKCGALVTVMSLREHMVMCKRR